MRKTLITSLSMLAAAAFALPADAASLLAGSWSGALNIGGTSLTIVFNIAENDAGQLPTVTLDSPDQGAKGIPTRVDYCQGDSIAIAVPNLYITYTGRLKGESIQGKFTQMGQQLPLVLTRGLKERQRPQEARPPFPYSTEEVTFSNQADSVQLAGTLTLPPNAGKHTPVVLMVSGSGLQNRDEELFGHKPFAVLADRLARAGIGSLRYDDRGAGRSTGDPTLCTTDDFARDACAGIAMLRSRGYARIGVLGHSEGGSIAFIAAGSQHKPDFLITLGAPAIDGASIITDQIAGQIDQLGATDEDKDCVKDVLSHLFTAITANPEVSGQELNTLIDSNISATIESHSIHSQSALHTINAIRESLPALTATPWMRHFLAYNPADDIRQATGMPVLAIYGSKDVQVRPALNEAPMRSLLPTATVKVYDNINHLMQPCLTGQATEYADIETTFSARVLDDIISFIKSHK